MRAVHYYYKYNYNKLKEKKKMNETLAPTISGIDDCYIYSEQRRFKANNNHGRLRCATQYAEVDTTELNITTDPLDFDRSFLRLLDCSIEAKR